MSNKNNSGIPDIPTWLIILLLFAATPLGLILLGIKYVLPQILSGLSGSWNPFEKKNRYSGFEKKDGNTVYTDFRDTTGQNTAAGSGSAYGSAPKYGTGANSNTNHYSNTQTGNSFNTNTGTNAGVNRNTNTESEPKAGKLGKIPYRISSVVLCILGALFLFFGIVIFTSDFIVHGTELFRSEDLGAYILMPGLGIILGAVGISLRNKVRLVKKYIAIIGERGRVKLSDIAGSLSRSNRKVQKELQKVIDSGIFGEYAYIDLGRQLFLRNASFAPEDEKAEPAKAQKTQTENESDLSEYERTLRKIRRLNDEIEDEQVSRRIDQIEDYTGRIFRCVEKDPSREKDVRTFMTYYLPTTLKLLESYSEIEHLGVAGDNMKSAKENIEKTLDLLVEAYKRLLDQLYASDNLDISSDIDVLEKMMEKDGLKGTGMGQN